MNDRDEFLSCMHLDQPFSSHRPFYFDRAFGTSTIVTEQQGNVADKFWGPVTASTNSMMMWDEGEPELTPEDSEESYSSWQRQFCCEEEQGLPSAVTHSTPPSSHDALNDDESSSCCSNGDASTNDSSTRMRNESPFPVSVLGRSFDDGTRLPANYTPSDNDVVCGRGKGCYYFPGNVKFRAVVTRHVDEYLLARTKVDKSRVLDGIFSGMRWHGEKSVMFVKQDAKTGVWYEMSDDAARVKVGHTIREAVLNRRNSRKCLNNKEADSPTRSPIVAKMSKNSLTK